MAFGSSARFDQTKTFGPTLCCKMSKKTPQDLLSLHFYGEMFLKVCIYYFVYFLRKGEDYNKSECPKVYVHICYESQFGVNLIGYRKHNLFKWVISLLLPTVNRSRMFSTGVISFAIENTNQKSVLVNQTPHLSNHQVYLQDHK